MPPRLRHLGEIAINREEVRRLKRVKEYIDTYKFPKVPRSDKLHPEDESPYRKEEVCPPEIIYFLSAGQGPEILDYELAVAIAGASKKHTKIGKELAWILARTVTRFGEENHITTIVNGGGVFGIDAAAFYGCMNVPYENWRQNEGYNNLLGCAVAVLGQSVKRGIYPHGERRPRFEEALLSRGGLVSQIAEPRPHQTIRTALERDHIITALSDANIAIECLKKSGTVDGILKGTLQGVPQYVVNWNNITIPAPLGKPPLREGGDYLLKMDRIPGRQEVKPFPAERTEWNDIPKKFYELLASLCST